MTRSYEAAPVTDGRDDHGEGPTWDARTDQLLWVDQYAGIVYVADVDSQTGGLQLVREYALGAPVGAVVPTTEANGGWAVAYDNGFGLLAADGSVQVLTQVEDAALRRMRMNDGKCAADGVFWAGSMAWDKTVAAGSLYRLHPDGEVSVALRGVTISNGLAWSADGRSLFYIDTPTQRVDRFHIDPAGELTDRVPVVVIPDEVGHPDGMTIDDEGCLWVALWDGSAVHRYSPTGELLARVPIDAPQVSSCCFGGADRATLFVTTSQEGMDDKTRARHANAGRVFSARVDVTGPAARPWGGPA
jgi:sugar lactone lactonase YvrE